MQNSILASCCCCSGWCGDTGPATTRVTPSPQPATSCRSEVKYPARAGGEGGGYCDLLH